MEKIVVLIVEDEPLIRMCAVQIVEDAGFATTEAGNADEAIGILSGRTDIQAVFTDINMPGSMDGLELARTIRRRWPHIHLLVTSGLIKPNRDQLPTDGRFIPKPYAGTNVVGALRELFGHKPSHRPLLFSMTGHAKAA